MGDPGPNNRWRAVRDRRKKMSATIKVSVLMDRKAALLAGLVVGERELIEAGPDSIGPELWPVLVGRLDMDACPPVLERTGLVAAPTVEALVAVLRAEQQAASAEAAKKEEEKRLTEEAVAAVMSQPFVSQLRYTHDPWDWAWEGVAQTPTDHPFSGVDLSADPSEMEYPLCSIVSRAKKARVDAENNRLLAEAVAAHRTEWEAQDTAYRERVVQEERDRAAQDEAAHAALIASGKIIVVKDKERGVINWVVEDGYTDCTCPPRGMSWLATVWADRSQKSGLGRTFWERGQRGWRQVPSGLAVGDYIEHGQKDKRGRPHHDYYRVLAVGDGKLIVREAGKPSLNPPPVGPEVEAAHLTPPPAPTDTVVC